MGMEKMFEQGNDFNKMVDLEAELPQPAGLGVGGVHQKAFIAVTEEGTEAAAASAVTMVAGTDTTTITEYYLEIVIDRPFLFLIQHKPTGTILFMGRLLQP